MKKILPIIFVLFCSQIYSQVQTVPLKLYEELKTEKETTEKELGAIKKKYDALQKDYAKLNNDIKILNAKLKNKGGSTSNLQKQLDSQKDKNAALYKSLNVKASKITELQKEIAKQKKAKSNIKDFKNEILNIEKDNAKNAAIIINKNREIKELEDEIKSLITEKEKFKIVKVKAKEYLEKLVESLKENTESAVDKLNLEMISFLNNASNSFRNKKLIKNIDELDLLKEKAQIELDFLDKELYADLIKELAITQGKLIHYRAALTHIKSYERQLNTSYNAGQIQALLIQQKSIVDNLPEEELGNINFITTRLNNYKNLLLGYCKKHNQSVTTLNKIINDGYFDETIKEPLFKKIQLSVKEYPFLTEFLISNKSAILKWKRQENNPLKLNASCN